MQVRLDRPYEEKKRMFNKCFMNFVLFSAFSFWTFHCWIYLESFAFTYIKHSKFYFVSVWSLSFKKWCCVVVSREQSGLRFLLQYSFVFLSSGFLQHFLNIKNINYHIPIVIINLIETWISCQRNKTIQRFLVIWRFSYYKFQFLLQSP